MKQDAAVSEKLPQAFEGFLWAIHHGDQTDFGVWRERLRNAIREAVEQMEAQ